MYKPKKENVTKLKSYLDKKDEKPNKRKCRRTRSKQYNLIYKFYTSRTSVTNTIISYINSLYYRKVYILQKQAQIMARKIISSYRAKTKVKRRKHSKNASKGQIGYKKKYKGQGR